MLCVTSLLVCFCVGVTLKENNLREIEGGRIMNSQVRVLCVRL